MGHLNELLNRPDQIRDPAFHCWPDFQSSMNAAKGIEREMQRQRSFQITSFTNQVASRKSTSLANIRLLAINPGVSQHTRRVEDQPTIPEIPVFGSTSQIPDLWLAEGIFPAP